MKLRHLQKLFWVLLLTLAIAVMANVRPAAACPNCRNAISEQPNSADGGSLNRGINTSIVAMLGVTGTLLFGLVRLIIRMDRLTPMPEDLPGGASGAPLL